MTHVISSATFGRVRRSPPVVRLFVYLLASWTIKKLWVDFVKFGKQTMNQRRVD